jgi:hypothetical protein
LNYYQPPPASRGLSATSVAGVILFLLLVGAVAFLRGPRVAAGLLGAGVAALAWFLLARPAAGRRFR